MAPPHPPHPPILVYAVTFLHNAAVVTVNHLGVPDTLWVSTSGVAGEQAFPGRGPLPMATPGSFGMPPAPALQYLALNITRPAGATSGVGVAVICALPVADVVAFNNLRHFRLRGTFGLPTPLPAGTTDQWAATVIARDNSDNEDDGTANVHVGATHQVRGGGKIALGAGQVPPNPDGTPAIVPPAIQELISFEEAYPFLSPRTFVLETDIDTVTRAGRSRLQTTGHEWQERRWMTPFNAADATAPKVTSVGVGLAMVLGAGSPTIRVHEFQIYAWQ